MGQISGFRSTHLELSSRGVRVSFEILWSGIRLSGSATLASVRPARSTVTGISVSHSLCVRQGTVRLADNRAIHEDVSYAALCIVWLRAGLRRCAAAWRLVSACHRFHCCVRDRCPVCTWLVYLRLSKWLTATAIRGVLALQLPDAGEPGRLGWLTLQPVCRPCKGAGGAGCFFAAGAQLQFFFGSETHEAAQGSLALVGSTQAGAEGVAQI